MPRILHSTAIPMPRCPLPLFLWFFFFGCGSVIAQEFQTVVRPFLEEFCIDCHAGTDAAGKTDFDSMHSNNDARTNYETWEKVDELLAHRQMPPAEASQPSDEQIAEIREWYQSALIDSIVAAPGEFVARRLSATEYRNTLRSLFGFDLEVNIVEAEQTISEKSLVMKLLPTDPPGPSGFRNDTTRNPISVQAWEQYAYLADVAIEEFFSPSRQQHVIEFIDRDTIRAAHRVDATDAAYQLSESDAITLIRKFSRLAYRRSLSPEASLPAEERLRDATHDIVAAVKQELKRILLSPAFLYRGLLMPRQTGRQPVDAFELAERLSYFLWADMPDESLFRVAKDGSLLEEPILQQQIDRMLNSAKSMTLSTDFAVQWLLLDEIDQVSDNPPVMVALKSQPIDFLRYLINEDRPILELVDSEVTFASPLTRKFYPQDAHQLGKYRRPSGIEIEIVPNQKLRLQHTKGRGGILTMPGVLAMNRGPILRGVWMLERVLGEHLPDPPANVGQVKANVPGENLTFRERFAQHRANSSCAVCHDKIDPLGFAFEHYDDRGNFRPTASSKKRNTSTEPPAAAIDASGQLPTGESFADFQELKQVLLENHRERLLRNVVRRLLAYALCRRLQIDDTPTVEDIVQRLLSTEGTWRQLISEIVLSVPFRETIVSSHEQ